MYEFDISEHLKTEEDIINYLNAIIEEDDSKLLQAAIGDVAKAKGMTEIVKQTGLGRESLYTSLSKNGNPSFATIQKVLAVFNLKLSVI
ncbi:MAG: putative addiction module antidote protein [Clostridiales Family XIII bacterium]|nr:putative addiction module antidote protein [Clostridiales Family XIII bacterium]